MKNTLTIDTPAKINLTLDIVKRRKDGYHNVSMIMQTIDLCDNIHFQIIEEGIYLTCNNIDIPTDSKNIIYRAASTLKEQYNVQQGVHIILDKRIPVKAGLAGGSSNAAGTLKALNELWHLNIDKKSLFEIGSNLGADVPFCMMEGTALAEGIGDILTPIKDLPNFYVLLIKPNIGISTPWAYSKMDINRIEAHPNNLRMKMAIESEDEEKIAKNLSNVFEQFIFPFYPELDMIKRKMKDLGAIGQLMSGSGPTIYGLYLDEELAMCAKTYFNKYYKDVFMVKTYNENKEEYHGV